MSNLINLDFTNVKDFTNLPAGKHLLKVKKYVQETASTGSPMITITFENAKGETGIDRFVLTDNALWKLKQLLTALFRTNFSGALQFDLDSMIGRTCTAVAKEEEYAKQDGTSDIRIVLDNYMPVNDADTLGVTPNAPTVPQPSAPVQPTAPVPPVQPTVASVPPVTPGYTAPVQPQPQAQAPVQPQVQPQPTVQGYANPIYGQTAPATPATPAQPTAQPSPAPATPVAKRPWEL